MAQRPRIFDAPATPLREHQILNFCILFESDLKALSHFCPFMFSVGFAAGFLVLH
jgi:hypothetical protein